MSNSYKLYLKGVTSLSLKSKKNCIRQRSRNPRKRKNHNSDDQSHIELSTNSHPSLELESEPNLNINILDDNSRPMLNETCSNNTAEDNIDFSNADDFQAKNAGILNSELNDFSENDYLLLLISFALKHNLTDAALLDLIKLVNIILKSDTLPNTLFKFLKPLKDTIKNYFIHYFCKMCNKILSFDSKQNILPVFCCSQKCSNFFILFDIEQHLKQLLENSEFAIALEYATKRQKLNVNSYEDLYDGALYKNLIKKENFQSGKDFTYCFSCDGAPLSRSSNLQIWPIFMSINELSPAERHRNHINAGFWVCNSQEELSLQTFLEKFAENINKLVNPGVSWLKNGNLMRSRFFPLLVIADAPARAKLQNIVSFSGYYGCNWCQHPGTHYENAVRYDYANPYLSRTKKNLIQGGKEAIKNGRIFNGIKGPSSLTKLYHFDPVWGVVPDYMHCLLLGVVKNIVEIWLTSAGQPFYIGAPRLRARIDKNMALLKPPTCISRYPRPISKWRQYKATEWQNFLLYYSLPCLNGILEVKYLEHFMKLREAATILLNRSISETDLTEVSKLLEIFVCDYENIYGCQNMVYNIHVLLHLPTSVKMCGPIWAYSAFPFENSIRLIKNQISGTKVPAKQIAKRQLMKNFISALPDNFCSSVVIQKCNNLFNALLITLIRTN